MSSKITLVTKVKILIGVLVVSLTTIATVTSYGFNSLTANLVQLQEREDPLQYKALEFKYNVLQVQQWLTDISATRGQDGLNDGFDEAAKHFDLAKGLLAELGTLDPDNRDFYQGILPALENFYAVGRKMAQAYVDLGPEGGNRTMASFDAAAEQMGRRLDQLIADVNERKATYLEEQAGIAAAATTTTVTLSLGLGVFILGGMWLLLRAVATLPTLRDAALRIAVGDLTGASVATASGDEFGQLANALEQMKQQLADSLAQISQGSEQVNQAVHTMTAVAEETNTGAARQRMEIEQVSTATTEMADTVQEVARSTQSAADAASSAATEVSTGDSVVSDTIASINTLAQQVTRASEVITSLEQDSDNIGTVLDVIRGIAEQTNLLALNAAIEAARAGEQGRGFAVVADEVRTLAQRTQQSTQEIQEMIESLQAGARQAVQVMESGREQVTTSVQHAEKAGQSLGTIRTAVDTIHDMNSQIAAAAEEQSAVATEINRNVGNISELIEQTAVGAQQATNVSNSLEQLSTELQQIVSGFRLQS